MSLRRPRIKNAVNLAALANGRRKDKGPTPEESSSPKQLEPVAEKPAEIAEPQVENTKNTILKVDQHTVNTENHTENSEIDVQNPEQTIVHDYGVNTKNADLLVSESDNIISASNVDILNRDINTSAIPNEGNKGTSKPSEQYENGNFTEENHKEANFGESSTQDKSIEAQKELKKIDSPFSPPAARPAPIGRFKSRFRPNLNENRNRIRRYSGTFPDLGSPPPCYSPQGHGSPHKKVRTYSCSSQSETEAEPEVQTQDEVLMKKPPTVHRIAVLNEVASPPPSFCPPEPLVKSSPDMEVKSPPQVIPVPAQRQRRITEARDSTEGLENRDPTVYEVRKADHRKKFTSGIPERTSITMFDLIYYNPSSGSRMSNSSSLKSSRANSRASSIDVVVRDEAAQLEMVRRRLEEEAVDDVAPIPEQDETVHDEEDGDEDAMPVPQVKVGPDGSIIIDESTTLIETTAAKRAKEDFMRSPLVFENGNRATNYGGWVKRKKTVDWTEKETVRFFKALSIFGTDFSMMENIFKRRTRHELKMKYKKEERQNRGLVDKCLTQGLQFDSSIMESEEEEEDEEEKSTIKSKGRRRSTKSVENGDKPKKKRVRKVKAKRGYYASSDEGDKEAEEEAQPPPVKKQRRKKNIINEILAEGININIDANAAEVAKKVVKPPRKRPVRKPKTPVTYDETQENIALSASPDQQRIISSPILSNSIATPSVSNARPPCDESSLLKSLLTKNIQANTQAGQFSPQGFAFPPALLAANPSLANAAPGSLVVVASPSSASKPNSQLLQVFVVGGPQQQDQQQQHLHQGFIIPDAASDDEQGDVIEEQIVPVVSSQTLENYEGSLDMSPAGRVRTFSEFLEH